MSIRQKSDPFVMLTKSLLESAAWRNLSINGRRLLEFLMLERMRHAGKMNRELLAPYRQLEEFGISARLITPTIAEVEESGLVIVRRGIGRRPSTYVLAWLGAVAPSDVKALEQTMPSKVKADYPHNGGHKPRSTLRREGANGVVPSLRTVAEVKAPYIKDLHQGGEASPLSQEEKDSVVFDDDGLPRAAAVR